MPEISFRNIEYQDLETLRQWRNSPNIARNMFSFGVITKEQQQAWFESIYRGERGHCWFVESAGTSVGYASLCLAERSNDCYEIGLYVGNQELIGGGYGSAILFNLLYEAFSKLNAHKVICEVLAFNTPAIKLYEKFGMQVQGYYKDFLKRGTERIDCVSYALFKQEWQNSRDELFRQVLKR